MLGNRADYEELEQYLSAPGGAVSSRGRDSLLLAALDEAVADITRRFGADTTAWRWGKIHVAELRHPLARSFDLPPVSRAGDANTVFATGGGNYRQSSGASYRQVIDLGDFEGVAQLFARARYKGGGPDDPGVKDSAPVLEILESMVRRYDDGTPRTKHVTTNLIINRDAPPFDDPKIRLAMAMSLDRKAFVDILSQGHDKIGTALLPPPEGVWGMPPEMLAG